MVGLITSMKQVGNIMRLDYLQRPDYGVGGSADLVLSSGV